MQLLTQSLLPFEWMAELPQIQGLTNFFAIVDACFFAESMSLTGLFGCCSSEASSSARRVSPVGLDLVAVEANLGRRWYHHCGIFSCRRVGNSLVTKLVLVGWRISINRCANPRLIFRVPRRIHRLFRRFCLILQDYEAQGARPWPHAGLLLLFYTEWPSWYCKNSEKPFIN